MVQVLIGVVRRWATNVGRSAHAQTTAKTNMAISVSTGEEETLDLLGETPDAVVLSGKLVDGKVGMKMVTGKSTALTAASLACESMIGPS